MNLEKIDPFNQSSGPLALEFLSDKENIKGALSTAQNKVPRWQVVGQSEEIDLDTKNNVVASLILEDLPITSIL